MGQLRGLRAESLAALGREPGRLQAVEPRNVLQGALGWTDSHLHQLRTDEAVYSMPFEDGDDEGETDERRVRLSALPPRFTYLYDFGDGWTHDVAVLGQLVREAGVDHSLLRSPAQIGGT